MQIEQKSRFNVIFQGEIKPECTVEQVKQNIANLYQLPIEKFNEWFSGHAVIIKRDIDHPTAMKYKQALEKTGFICHIKPVVEADKGTHLKNTKNKPVSSVTMTCPKCGFEQAQAEECIRCKVVISKYLEYKKQIDSVSSLNKQYAKIDTHLEYKQCKCKFWITSNDNYCPNCGLELSGKTTKAIMLFFLISFVVEVGVLLGITGFKTSGILGMFLEGGFGAIIGGLFGLLCCIVIKLVSWRTRWTLNLINTEKKIQNELNWVGFQQKVGNGIKKVHQTYEESQDVISWIADTSRRQEFYRNIEILIDDVKLKTYRLQAYLWQLQLVRWQNALTYLFSNWIKKAEDTYKNRLAALEKLSQMFDNTIQEWIQSEVASIPEGYQCVLRLHKASTITKQIYQRLVKENGLNVNFDEIFDQESPFTILPDAKEFYSNLKISLPKNTRQTTLLYSVAVSIISIFWAGIIVFIIVMALIME